jgi:hypothetical protein
MTVSLLRRWAGTRGWAPFGVWSRDRALPSECFLAGVRFAPVLHRSHGGAPPSNHFGTGKSVFGTRKSERDAFLESITREGLPSSRQFAPAITLTLGIG